MYYKRLQFNVNFKFLKFLIWYLNDHISDRESNLMAFRVENVYKFH